jgi:hypothetical protein
VYGALIPKKMTAETHDGKEITRDPMTFIGRVVHGGGVAVQTLPRQEKQRAMHPSVLHKEPEKDPTPTPFKRQYHEPGLLYPVQNHCLSVTDDEFSAVAYAFLDSLARLGAGNPKGVSLYEIDLLGAVQPALVLDRYLAPLGKRPVVSPVETSTERAVERFCSAAQTVEGQRSDGAHVTRPHFERWIGDTALTELQRRATGFVEAVLETR